MKKFTNYIVVFLISLFAFNISCYASNNMYVRTTDNLRVPKDVEVNDDNLTDIMNTPSIASDEKIYDFANILMPKEEEELFESINEYIKISGFDCVIVTTNSLTRFNISDYTYNFYDYNDFKDDGVIFVIYMNGGTPEIFMGNSGKDDSKIFQIYDDKMINSTLKYIYENSIVKSNYYEACNNFVKIINGFYNKNASGNYKVDDEGNIVKTIPILEIIIIALAITFIIVILLWTKLKDKKRIIVDNTKNKVDTNTMIIKNEYDNLIDTIVK